MEFLLSFLLPILAGSGLYWFAGKCRGRNARTAFRFAGWGSWLLLLRFLTPIVPLPPFLWPISALLLLLPSALCFFLAANSLLKEMRSQKQGEYTDVA